VPEEGVCGTIDQIRHGGLNEDGPLPADLDLWPCVGLFDLYGVV
jgi:hypothetical protein